MTSAPNSINPAVRPQQHAPASAAQGMGVDPVKLILRSKWLLAGAAGAGLVLGTIAHVAWLYSYPFYKPRAIFECFPPETSPWNLPGAGGVTNNDEVTTFMQTQVRIMTSEDLLQSLVEGQKFKDVAPKWSDRFKKSDGTYNTTKMFSYLEDDLSAKVLTQTRLIELTFVWKYPDEAAAIVKLVMDEYMDRVRRLNDIQFQDRTNALNKNIEDAKREILLLQGQESAIIKTNRVDSVDQRLTETADRISLVNRRIQELSDQKLDVEKRLEIREAQKNHESGVAQIPEEIKVRVARDPFLINLQQDMTSLATALEGLKLNGIQPEHRRYKQVQSQLDATRSEFQTKQQELWTLEFESEINEMRNMQQSLQRQTEVAKAEVADLRIRQVDLSGVITNLDNIKEKIRAQQNSVQSASDKLRELNVVIAQPTAARILPRQVNIREPKEPYFPKIYFMVPAGALLCLGLVGGVVVLREVVDQRIKGPGDINLIPRTRLLGWVADASEDPAGPGVVETAFRDRPKGLLAENFRQIRSSLLKKLEIAGHKTVVVAGCMPSSGSTSVASNLALAAAAAGKNVLLIDANFRRPALHRVFGVTEGPGLGDVLAGEQTLAGAAQAMKDNPNLKILSAGPSAKRVYEALASDAFGKILADARAAYDVVFVDVAPAVVSGDAVTIANRADSSILVARTFSEKRGMIARIKNELTESRGEFLGVIVNGVKTAAGGYLKGNIQATHDYHSEAESKA